MRTKDYIHALAATLQNNSERERVFTHLRAHLEKKGLMSLYSRILRGTIERMKRQQRTTKGRFIVAREKDITHALKASAEHQAVFGEFTKDMVEVNPNIIGGYILERNSTRLDKSHKSALLAVYKKLTH